MQIYLLLSIDPEGQRESCLTPDGCGLNGLNGLKLRARAPPLRPHAQRVGARPETALCATPLHALH